MDVCREGDLECSENYKKSPWCNTVLEQYNKELNELVDMYKLTEVKSLIESIVDNSMKEILKEEKIFPVINKLNFKEKTELINDFLREHKFSCLKILLDGLSPDEVAFLLKTDKRYMPLLVWYVNESDNKRAKEIILKMDKELQQDFIQYCDSKKIWFMLNSLDLDTIRKFLSYLPLHKIKEAVLHVKSDKLSDIQKILQELNLKID